MPTVEQLVAQLKALRVQEDKVIKELEAALTAKANKTQNTNDFRVGDRVTITNRVTSRIFGKTTESDRAATVRKVKHDEKGNIVKVFLVTDNNLATHRLPKFLEKRP